MAGNIEFEPPGADIVCTPYESQNAAILQRVRELCNWNRPTFPGSQPVSLAAFNLGELSRKPYVACEKTDGVRYLLFAASGLVFLVDRKETNGELVQDVLPDGSSHICFLVYDLIALNRDSNVSKLNLLERLKLCLLEFVQPRAKYVTANPQAIEVEKSKNSFFEIYLKDFFEIWDILAIRNSSKRLPHLSDGIIFTPVALPYVAGTCKSLLKWKPPELNTVDFAAVLVYAPDSNSDSVPIGAKLLIGSRGLRRDSGFWVYTGDDKWKMVVERRKSHQDCDGCIFECAYDSRAEIIVPRFTEDDMSGHIRQWQADQRAIKKQRFENGDASSGVVSICPYGRVKDSLNFYDFSKAEKLTGGWVVERIRTDRNSPNDERVMHKVKESIDSGIDFVTLFYAILGFRESSKLKPLSTRCQLPEYYGDHGSRTILAPNAEMKKFVEQAERIHQGILLNKTGARMSNELDGRTSLMMNDRDAHQTFEMDNHTYNGGDTPSGMQQLEKNEEVIYNESPFASSVNDRMRGGATYILDQDDDDEILNGKVVSSSSSEEE